MYYTYLARCSDNTLYIGYTDNLEKREKVHNVGKGSRYTRARLPLKIVYFEEFQSKSEAMKREFFLKTLKKKEKEGLIKLMNE